MIKQSLKAGTRIQMLNREAEIAVIARWTLRNGAIRNHVSQDNGGWHIITFADGGQLCVHERAFRIIDNRA